MNSPYIMKKKLLRLIAICTLVPVVFLTGCSGSNPIFEFNLMDELFEEFDEPSGNGGGSYEEPKETVEVELPETMNEAYIDFSISLLQKTVQKSENALISPASVEFALAMAMMGAEGESLNEMMQVLCPDATEEEIVSYIKDLNLLLTDGSDADFYVANSVWTNETLLGDCLNEAYISQLEEEMDAEAHMLPFDEDAVREINGWVDDNTDGMIPTLIDKIDPLTVMYLINAMTFEAEWHEQYEEYQMKDSIFTNGDGVEEDATMLCETGSIYFENDDATGFMKYYDGGDYAFLAMLPKEEGAIDEFVANMTADDYMEFYNSKTREYDVVTELPCFTYSYETLMNDALTELGMPSPFVDGTKDFAPMVTDPDVNLFISRVIHKTYIELDENGTRAAAVTAIVMDNESCAMPVEVEVKEVILDRPFVYAIVDTSTGMPIFLGTVNSLAE